MSQRYLALEDVFFVPFTVNGNIREDSLVIAGSARQSLRINKGTLLEKNIWENIIMSILPMNWIACFVLEKFI